MEFINTIDWSFWGPVLSILILICLSGFFSGSETALTAVSKARMLTLEKEGNKRAGVVNVLIERKDRLIGALLLGNNLVNILASAIATAFFINLVGEAGVVYATLVMTVIVLVFAEVLPKTYALANSDKMALFIAPLIRVVVFVFSPITSVIARIVNGTLRTLGLTHSDVNMADMAVQELRGAIELAHDSENENGQAKESSEKRAMLRSILDLVDVDVEDVMTHRSNVTALDADEPIHHLVDQVLDSPYTRIPVWQDNKDNIIGIIHAKIMLRELRGVKGDVDKLSIKSMMLEPWFVPETTTLFDQLQAFRERKEHFAIVVDEYGASQGIVTLEDILEEIVGEIDDEQDLAATGIKDQGDGSYVIEGTATVRDVNRELDWDLPDEDYTTLAGLILHESKMVPEEGQNFIFFGYRFSVLLRERHQIKLLKIIPPEQDTKEN
jgi:Mg2+/Co2+ transporter CorB